MKIKYSLLLAGFLTFGSLTPAHAIDCESEVARAESSVKAAITRLEEMKKDSFKGRVRVLVDDASMNANSAKRLCSRQSPTRLTRARAAAQAGSAISWANAAIALADEYAKQ